MTATCVHVHVKAEWVEEFIRITTINHLESVKEPGNMRFDLLQQAENPSRFTIYEAYESEGQAAAHKSTAHYLKWRDDVKDMMAEPRFGVKYKILQPQKA
jgi:(4S)-4-hydroxy-5-phosphonooxypentane-2,3-dione isomerase